MAEAGEDAQVDEQGDWLGPERLLAFSDGVVAIALTLLVLPLAELVPEVAEPETSGLTVITDNLAAIGSFVLSFAVIARFWAAHHRVFDRARRVSHTLVGVNTAWLFTIVVLPFPTEMIASFPEDPFTLRFYVATLFASSALLTVTAVLVRRSLPGDEAQGLRNTAAGGTALLLLLVLVVTLVAPSLGYWPLLLLFLTSPIERVLGPLVERRLARPPSG
ncbi:TMEM175 family protein [Actinomycetospora lemnae]|uniref:TMEM175 family protein n=1 Tax=Actinomycetospora lemnae TaxID=3019891 RepID=A0ABT5SQB0_9PSEU|nr:TMEM175 family protein [Actinomycetospora sp. DW7H6]MDD7965004.1 TMEM175 family protein [Actinomycetospora sp. DW7H6]